MGDADGMDALCLFRLISIDSALSSRSLLSFDPFGWGSFWQRLSYAPKFPDERPLAFCSRGGFLVMCGMVGALGATRILQFPRFV